MENNQEIFITDMYEAFEPKEIIKRDGQRSTWSWLTYNTVDYNGTMLLTPNCNQPSDLSFDPKLCGWYKIYITFAGAPGSILHAKLSSDSCFVYVMSHQASLYDMEQVFWRCADLTDEKIVITTNNTSHQHAAIAALRFIPMTDEEIALCKADKQRTDTKRMYVTEDMGNCFWDHTKMTPDDWRSVVACYRDSDVEWFSAEFSPPLEEDPPKDWFNNEIYAAMVDEAHKLGIKFAVSNRMGHWGVGYPYYFKGSGYEFVDDHPEYHCLDRDGSIVGALSYAFPEVRKHKIDAYVTAAKCGADAVCLLACRGVPYVLFEKPVADAFYEKYGEYPYEYTFDDPKLRDIHCEFMTQYLREMRQALDEEFGKNKIRIQLRGFNSIEDCANIGFDVYKLAEEGLIDEVATHTRRYFEDIPPELMKEDDPTKIDIEKFTKHIYANTGNSDTTALYWEDACYAPFRNSRGIIPGPRSFEENVQQWKEFSDKFGIRVYHEMFHMCKDPEKAKKNIEILYQNGGDGITLFNTCMFSHNPVLWPILAKSGHKDEFSELEPTPSGYKKTRVYEFDGVNMNRYKPLWGG